MCILERPRVLAPLALHPLPMPNTQYDITYLNYTKRCFFFLVEKGAPSLLYRNIYFNDC